MGDELDAVRFFDELTEFVDHFSSGRSGLTGLRRIMDLGLWSLPAPGLALIEFGPAVGRVIAACGTAGVALGRRIESGDPHIIELQRGDRVAERTDADLPADLREALDADEPGRYLVGRVTLGARPIAMLVALVPPADDLDARRLSAMTYLTSAIGRIYRDDVGLPLHADPAPRVPAETTVLLDTDGNACWLNPKNSAVIAAAGVTMGAPLPLPRPGPGQVIEHNLPDGRWLRVTSHRLPDGAGESIAIRDVSEARRWEQSRELFVALASHELRTPVTVIKGYADTLTDRWDALDDRGRRHAARVLGLRAGDLARLLDRLLSAVGEPGIPPVVSRFDLRAAIVKAIDALPSEVRARIDADLPAPLPPVFGEPTSIASVVSELVTNAMKYAPPATGPVEITVVSDARTVGFSGFRPGHWRAPRTRGERLREVLAGRHR